jgi:MFS family permease
MDAVTNVGMVPNEKKLLAYVSLAHSVNHTLDVAYAAILGVLVLEFNTTEVTLGLIATLNAFGIGLTAVPAGFLADRIGSKRTIILSLYGSAGAALLVAVSPGVWQLGASMALMGLTAGLYHPAGLSAITRGIRRRSMGLGYHGVAGNTGVFVAPGLTVLVAGIWNWQAAFIMWAILCVVVGLIFQRASQNVAGEASVSAMAPGLPVQWNRAMYLRPLVVVFAITFVEGFMFRAAIVWLPIHFQENLEMNVFGLDPFSLGGYMVTIVLFFGAVGQYAGGILGERFRRETLALPLVGVMVPALVVMGFAHGYPLLISASAFAFLNFMTQPIYGTLVADYSPVRVQGRVFGVMFLVSAGLGSVGGLAGGVIAHNYGVQWVFPLLAILAALVLAMTFYLSIAVLARSRRLVAAQG